MDITMRRLMTYTTACTTVRTKVQRNTHHRTAVQTRARTMVPITALLIPHLEDMPPTPTLGIHTTSKHVSGSTHGNEQLIAILDPPGGELHLAPLRKISLSLTRELLEAIEAGRLLLSTTLFLDHR